MSQDEIEALRELLAQLTAELADREAALPAHSVRPGQLVVIEELEAQISELKEKIKQVQASP